MFGGKKILTRLLVGQKLYYDMFRYFNRTENNMMDRQTDRQTKSGQNIMFFAT